MIPQLTAVDRAPILNVCTAPNAAVLRVVPVAMAFSAQT
jgi:hypothetical protein